MTRTYALKRLLEHGAMRASDVIDCTRWKPSQVYRTAQHLIDQGIVERKVVAKRDGCRVAYEAVV